jgi:AcrR family transcriptional regulator
MNDPVKKPKKRHVERPDVKERLLDAAEAIIFDEGYSSATARKISAQAGLTHQAVFYYFGSVDELLVALLRRSTEKYIDALKNVLSSNNPLQNLWSLLNDGRSTRLSLEFLAMANHNQAVGNEIAKKAEVIRHLENIAIEDYLSKRPQKVDLPPELLSIVINALARLMVQEANLGINMGHESIQQLVDTYIKKIEG